MSRPKQGAKPTKAPKKDQLAAVDVGQLANVTGGCGGHRHHCCGNQQPQINNIPYYYDPYGGYGNGGGYYGRNPYDVVTTVDYGNGQQQQVINNGVPTSGNSYNR